MFLASFSKSGLDLWVLFVFLQCDSGLGSCQRSVGSSCNRGLSPLICRCRRSLAGLVVFMVRNRAGIIGLLEKVGLWIEEMKADV